MQEMWDCVKWYDHLWALRRDDLGYGVACRVASRPFTDE